MTQNLIDLNLNSDNQPLLQSPINCNNKLNKAGNNYTNLSELVSNDGSSVSKSSPSIKAPYAKTNSCSENINCNQSSANSISHSDFSIKSFSDISYNNDKMLLPDTLDDVDSYYFFLNHIDEESLASAISFTVKTTNNIHTVSDQLLANTAGSVAHLQTHHMTNSNSLTPSKSENNIFDRNLSLPKQSFDVVSLTNLNDEAYNYVNNYPMNDLSKTQILNRNLSEEDVSKINRY
jgi:hypothetical protein